MQEKVCFSFFILCAILSQGILAEILGKDVEELSKNVIREKRVVDRRPGQETPLKTGDLPYIAIIKDGVYMHCVSAILSKHTAITAARCVDRDNLENYQVVSGSANIQYGEKHNITEKKVHGLNPPRTRYTRTGIALIIVDPPFVYNPRTTSGIPLHSGLILEGMEGIVAGWGYRIDAGQIESNHVKRLRIITVPVINHRECQIIYSRHFPITDEDICTYHPEKLCADKDAGTPLIIDNQLAGIHIGRINTLLEECPMKPDVFVLLQHLNYGPWIMNNIVH